MSRLQFQRHHAKGKILNVGCGDDSANLKGNFGSLNLDVTSSRRTQQGQVVTHDVDIFADAHYLPFKDNIFDTVVLGDIIEHNLDPWKLIEEAVRASRENVVITVPSDERVLNFDRAEIEKQLEWGAHVYYVTEEELVEWIRCYEIKEFREIKDFGKDPDTGYKLEGFGVVMSVHRKKVCLIVVDCLRYDEVPLELIPEGFKLYRCRALSNTTEPSLANILSGFPPQKHGILEVGHPDSPQKLTTLRLLPKQFNQSFIASPAVILHPYFTYASMAKYSEEAAYEAEKYLSKVSFIMIHIMDLHDLRDLGKGVNFYTGYEPVDPEVYKWKPPSNLPRPYETDFRAGDAGLLKAKYRGAVRLAFRNLNRFISCLEDWIILITGDHGESFKYWHHDGVEDEEVFEVPLITNIKLKHKQYTHLDIYKIVCGGELYLSEEEEVTAEEIPTEEEEEAAEAEEVGKEEAAPEEAPPEELPNIFVIDKSEPVGSLTGARRLIVLDEKKGYPMNETLNEWVREHNIPIKGYTPELEEKLTDISGQKVFPDLEELTKKLGE